MAKPRVIKKIIVHCTDSPDDLDIGFKAVNEWHKERGFESPSGIHCGYHWVVRRDGRVEKGRPESETGAHCKGQNSTSIGVVWVGRKHPTPEQYASLLKTLREVCNRHGLTADQVYGHREFDPGKTCPNLDVDRLRAEVLFTKVTP
jgi:N-acetylmuramoyl-L-alanine amidase